MATETKFPSGDDNGWPTGNWDNIEESIASADGATLETNIDDDVVVIDVGDFTTIADADTVTNVDIDIRAKDTGAGGKNSLNVNIDVGGGPLTAVTGANMNNTYATYSFTQVSWNIDHTAAQLNNMQLIIRANQTGMGTAADWQIDAIDVTVTFTPAATGFTPSVMMF